MGLQKIGIIVFLCITSLQSRLLNYTFEGTVSESIIEYSENGNSLSRNNEEISVGTTVTYSILSDLERDGYLIDDNGEMLFLEDESPTTATYYGDYFYNEFNGDYLLPDLTEIDDLSQSFRGCNLYNFYNSTYSILFVGQYYHNFVISTTTLFNNSNLNQRFQGRETSTFLPGAAGQYTLSLTTSLRLVSISDPYANVPEPSSTILFSSGFFIFVFTFRFRKKQMSM